MEEKVIVRFESTLDSQNTEPLLLSGPIQIFASVDLLRDPRDKEGNLITDKDHPLYGLVGLDNIDLIKEIKNEENRKIQNIIVFVNDVASIDSQTHRGAYFLYVGNRDTKSLNCDVENDWQEILLGTHSHENKEQLDNLAELTNLNLKEDKLLSVGTDGNFKLIDIKKELSLPPLPLEIQNALKKEKERKELESKYSEEEILDVSHHLDAPLEELNDTYDWLVPDKNGVYKNISTGTCRDLFYSLLKSSKRLYLNEKDGEFSISSEKESDIFLALESANFTFNENKKDGYANVLVDETNKNRNIICMNLLFEIEKTDVPYVFIDDEYINSERYNILKQGEKSINLLFFKPLETTKKHITILFLRGKNSNQIPRSEFAEQLSRGKPSLNDINKELINLYIQGEFNKKEKLQRYYLATNEDGELYWDNKILPSQHFYANSITLNNNNIDMYRDEETGNVKLVFENVYLDVTTDFPLLLADNYFAFDLRFDPDFGENGKDLIYWLDKDSKYLNWKEGYSEDEIFKYLEESATFTLIVIKNTANQVGDGASNALLRELADNYVSKDDAIGILSHGKIKLKDYAKKDALTAYSRLGHTHSQYAKVGHNHDFRYANYHHTHPEFSAILAAKVGLDYSTEEGKKTIDTWIDRLTGGISTLVDAAANSVINNGNFSDSNIRLDSATITDINQRIIDENLDIDLLENEGPETFISLKDALNRIIAFINTNHTDIEDVSFEDTFYITNKIGGLKDIYSKENNDTVYDLLRDMLNPRVSVESVKKLLTPKEEFIEIRWFPTDFSGNIKDGVDEKGIDILNIQSWKFNETDRLFFKIYLKNENKEDCEFVINYNNILTTLKTEYEVLSHSKTIETLDMYEYTNNGKSFNFMDGEDEYEPIIIRYYLNGKIYDSYGQNPTDFESKVLEPIDPIFIIKQPDYYAGVLILENKGYDISTPIAENDSLWDEFANKKDSSEIIKYSGTNDIVFKLETDTIEYMIIAVRQDILQENSCRFLDERLVNVLPFFEVCNKPVNINDDTYWIRYYKVLNSDADILKLKLKVKILNVQEED